MDRWPLALFVGLLGGAAGAVAVDILRGSTSPAAAPAAEAAQGGASREVLDRLERIESLLRPLEAPAPLAGRSPDGAAGTGTDVAAAAEEARLKRIEASVEAAVERKVKEMGLHDVTARPANALGKKRLSIKQAAAELGLSRAEEDTVRRFYDEANEKLLKLLAGEDGDVEAVRRDLEAAKSEKGRGLVMMKYLPKALPKIGELAAIGMERDAKVEETLGPDRAGRWEGFDIEEGNPLGLGGSVRMEARNR